MPVIVAGKLRIAAGLRNKFLERAIPSIRQARETEGCGEFSVSADPIDADRVNVFERWADRASLEAFRESGPGDDLFSLVESFDIQEYDV